MKTPTIMTERELDELMIKMQRAKPTVSFWKHKHLVKTWLIEQGTTVVKNEADASFRLFQV